MQRARFSLARWLPLAKVIARYFGLNPIAIDAADFDGNVVCPTLKGCGTAAPLPVFPDPMPAVSGRPLLRAT